MTSVEAGAKPMSGNPRRHADRRRHRRRRRRESPRARRDARTSRRRHPARRRASSPSSRARNWLAAPIRPPDRAFPGVTLRPATRSLRRDRQITCRLPSPAPAETSNSLRTSPNTPARKAISPGSGFRFAAIPICSVLAPVRTYAQKAHSWALRQPPMCWRTLQT